MLLIERAAGQMLAKGVGRELKARGKALHYFTLTLDDENGNGDCTVMIPREKAKAMRHFALVRSV